MRSLLLFLAAVVSVGSAAAQTPPASSPDARAAAFTQRLLSAISHRNIDALATMIRLPLSVHTGSVLLPVTNRAALAKAFDTVFTPELGCALERSVGSSAAAGSIAHEGTSVTVGHGAIHLQPSADSFTVTQINEPAGASPAAPRSQPRQLNVPSGQVQQAGTLAVGGADRYVVAARQGDVLQARIERFQGRAIGVQILDANTHRVIGSGDEASRVTSATAAATGDVAVEVTRLTFCEPAVSYLLTISKHH